MAKLLIILMVVFGLLVSASDSAPDLLQDHFEQLLQSILFQETAAETDLQETALEQDAIGETDLKNTAHTQNIPLEHQKSSYAGPYCSAGRLMLSEEKGCTAFMIEKNHALTARHCVQNRKSTGYRGAPYGGALGNVKPLSDLTLCLRRNCNFQGRCLTATKVRVSKKADYALITYQEDVYCTHWLRYSNTWEGKPVELFGYPNKPPGNLTKCPYNALCHSACGSSKGVKSGDRIHYDCEGPSGMSGSPVSVPSKSGVLGVHTRVVGVIGMGVLITKDRYCGIAACINEDGNTNFGKNHCSARSCDLIEEVQEPQSYIFKQSSIYGYASSI